MLHTPLLSLLFFFNDTATTEIYTLSLHDALPISAAHHDGNVLSCRRIDAHRHDRRPHVIALHKTSSVTKDRKSTRLNSSHQIISYAVFCLKKKKTSRSPRHPFHSPRPGPRAR